ncbi:2-oxoacid:acceptor oxidoreductase family protein [Lachnospiraceae bacterium ZAX-1]
MEIVFAGFGGQGVLTSGLIVAYIAMKNDYEVLWSPAYGGEMRGGKAYSMVKFDHTEIAEPNITELDALVAMNRPSLEFCENLKPNGLLIVNSDTISDEVLDSYAFRTIRIPINRLAQQAGSGKTVNIVSVGALIRSMGIFDREKAEEIMCLFFEEKGKGVFNRTNRVAFGLGYEYE